MERERRGDRIEAPIAVPVERRAAEIGDDRRQTAAQAAGANREHVGIVIHADDVRLRAHTKHPRREGAGPGAEIQDPRPARGHEGVDCGSRCLEHLFVIGDERADARVVFAQIDAEMRGVRRHSR